MSTFSYKDSDGQTHLVLGCCANCVNSGEYKNIHQVKCKLTGIFINELKECSEYKFDPVKFEVTI